MTDTRTEANANTFFVGLCIVMLGLLAILLVAAIFGVVAVILPFWGWVYGFIFVLLIFYACLSTVVFIIVTLQVLKR